MTTTKQIKQMKLKIRDLKVRRNRCLKDYLNNKAIEKEILNMRNHFIQNELYDEAKQVTKVYKHHDSINQSIKFHYDQLDKKIIEIGHQILRQRQFNYGWATMFTKPQPFVAKEQNKSEK